jgi:putative IMPACT (imprinted ancient) family translation regulator
MRKQRNQAREQYDRVEEERHKAQVSFKDALEFIKALEKENGQLMEQVGSLMFTVEIMQNEINKLQK